MDDPYFVEQAKQQQILQVPSFWYVLVVIKTLVNSLLIDIVSLFYINVHIQTLVSVPHFKLAYFLLLLWT